MNDTANVLLCIDVMKSVLLKRMDREFKLVMTDNHLSKIRKVASAILYGTVGNDFVDYIKSLHEVQTPGFLVIMAGNAVKYFQDNLDSCWVFAYDGTLGPKRKIKWLSHENIEREIFNGNSE